jgi:hypothetical protein
MKKTTKEKPQKVSPAALQNAKISSQILLHVCTVSIVPQVGTRQYLSDSDSDREEFEAFGARLRRRAQIRAAEIAARIQAAQAAKG